MILESKYLPTFICYDPEDFNITPGSETNLRHSKSGKLWGVKVSKYDTLSLTLSKDLPENLQNLQNWLYTNSKLGFREKSKLTLTINRARSSDSKTLGGDYVCSNKAFRGEVMFLQNEMSVQTGFIWAGGLSLSFKILQTLDFSS
jgi:hypothetical protein